MSIARDATEPMDLTGRADVFRINGHGVLALSTPN
jgi:hypothetical protein